MCAQHLVGQSLAPANPWDAYEQICGGFWYYSLRTLGKIKRQEPWAARYEFNFIVTGLLHALLRIEVGAVARWRASESSVGIEHVLSPERLIQLNLCIPGSEVEAMRRALGQTSSLAAEICTTIEATRGGPWPHLLAARLFDALGEP